MRLAILISLIFILVASCSTSKKSHEYSICVKKEAVKSKIVEDYIVTTKDTAKATLSGQVFDMFTGEPVSFASIILKNIELDSIKSQSTDSLGRFSIVTIAGDYLLDVSFITYQRLTQKITLLQEKERKINIQLGSGSRFVTYSVKSDKKLGRRGIKRMAKKLSKNN